MAAQKRVTAKKPKRDRWIGASGQTFERLPDGLLLVNGTTLVCCVNGGSPMDFGPAAATHESEMYRRT